MQHTSEAAIESFHALVPWSPGSCDQTVSLLQGCVTVWQERPHPLHCKELLQYGNIIAERDTAHEDWQLHVKCSDQFLRTWECTHCRCMLCPWRPTTLINSTQFAQLHLSTFVDNTNLESTSFIMHVQWILLVWTLSDKEDHNYILWIARNSYVQ